MVVQRTRWYRGFALSLPLLVEEEQHNSEREDEDDRADCTTGNSSDRRLALPDLA